MIIINTPPNIHMTIIKTPPNLHMCVDYYQHLCLCIYVRTYVCMYASHTPTLSHIHTHAHIHIPTGNLEPLQADTVKRLTFIYTYLQGTWSRYKPTWWNGWRSYTHTCRAPGAVTGRHGETVNVYIHIPAGHLEPLQADMVKRLTLWTHVVAVVKLRSNVCAKKDNFTGILTGWRICRK